MKYFGAEGCDDVKTELTDDPNASCHTISGLYHTVWYLHAKHRQISVNFDMICLGQGKIVHPNFYFYQIIFPDKDIVIVPRPRGRGLIMEFFPNDYRLVWAPIFYLGVNPGFKIGEDPAQAHPTDEIQLKHI